MDLNYLLHRQQVERSRARAAASEEARAVHEALARQYEKKIEKLTGGGLRLSRQPVIISKARRRPGCAE